MMKTRLKGMGVALITPFKEDGSVDYDALKHHNPRYHLL